jgi:curli biogenesis system outer membrane secretion channel CsgG
MRWVVLGLAALGLAGCTLNTPEGEGPQVVRGGDHVAVKSADYKPLAGLPMRRSPVTIAVYDIPDLTGANLRTEEFAEFSKAVSQGADALVVEALSEVGGGSWFRIVERKAIDPLLQERRMALSQADDAAQRQHALQAQADRERMLADIDAEVATYRAKLEADYQSASAEQLAQMPPFERALADLQSYADTRRKGVPMATSYDRLLQPAALPQMLIADYIMTGAIVAHDTDVLSRGTGLRIQNVGVMNRVQKDVITVNLRLVDVGTGEIVANRTVSQTVLSRKDQGDTMNYITLNRILEFETGVVTNEPRSLALDAAFRLAIYGILQDMGPKLPR